LQQELNQKVVLPGVIPAGELGQLRHTQALVVPVLQVYIRWVSSVWTGHNGIYFPLNKMTFKGFVLYSLITVFLPPLCIEMSILLLQKELFLI
jgi:hypothetical protein